MREILSDLVAEEQSLDQFLQGLHERDWKLPTMAPGWSIHDTISHLAYTEWAAVSVINGQAPLDVDDIDEWTAQGVIEGRPKRYQEVIEWWRSGRAAVVDALSKKLPSDRIDWVIAPMSARAFATLRLMETWAHGLDIKMALADRFKGEPEDDPLNDSPRLRHVAWLAHRMLPWSFELAGEEFPSGGIRLELMGPNYARWVYGPADAENVIKGIAGEWCRIAVHRLDVSATNLKAEGEQAEVAVRVVRAY